LVRQIAQNQATFADPIWHTRTAVAARSPAMATVTARCRPDESRYLGRARAPAMTLLSRGALTLRIDSPAARRRSTINPPDEVDQSVHRRRRGFPGRAKASEPGVSEGTLQRFKAFA